MEGKRFIHKIKLTNLLSFGPEGMELKLEPLNVLIGPNGSGKSNFIEAFSILKAAPTDLAAPFREGGGIGEWLWKGAGALPAAQLEAVVDWTGSRRPLDYRLSLAVAGQQLQLVDETIAEPVSDQDEKVYYHYDRETQASLRYRLGRPEAQPKRSPRRIDLIIHPADLKLGQSILAQRRDPDQYPEITYLGQQFDRIALYRDWRMGPGAATRQHQATDRLPDYLEEDARNLHLILNNLEVRLPPGAIPERLARVHELAERITPSIIGNSILLYLHERGLQSPVPAVRLSDGTLRFLFLLAILLHPEPPPLICIEEPELGLHPDVIRTVAELLIEASQRTQLIVTTHSDFLVSALSEVPESVVVCERGAGGTRMERLKPDQLKEWLKEYSLGDLWVRGHLGGNRW